MATRFFLPRTRVYLLLVAVALIWLVIAARLVEIQVIKAEQCRREVEIQSRGEVILPAERGRIIDFKDRTLAANVACKSFFAYPTSVKDANRIARAVLPHTKKSLPALRKQLKNRLESFTWLCRKLPDQQARLLDSQKLPGLFSHREMKRVYPNNILGRDLLGMVDIDNKGISGLEYALDDQLSGRDGRAIIERDAKGKIYRPAAHTILEPQNGLNVMLTIDLDWQAIVEAELKQGLERYGARSGMAVFLKPADGAVLAIASCDQVSEKRKSIKNEAIANLFEPGSVLKLITVAAVLEEEILTPTDTIDCGNGVAEFSGRKIRDDKKWEVLSFRDAFRVSSNIGMGRAAVMLGPRKLYKYAKLFGFGRKSGIDLPGESAGMLREPEVWSDFYCASLAMGHGLSVNTLQMAAAFGVVVSGGSLYQPYIIKQVATPDGQVINSVSPRKVRDVLSDETCRILKQFLTDVVDSGTAKYAKSELIDFSGKTGTPQKPNLKDGGYYTDRYIATFAGYFPRQNPVAVGVVVLDEPQPVHYAGMTSARIFAKIAERIMPLARSLDMPRYAVSSESYPQPGIIVPDLIDHTLAQAREVLSQLSLDIQLVNEGETVCRQNPPAGTRLLEGDRLILYLASEQDLSERGLDRFVGLSVRNAVTELMQLGYEVELKGHGFVKQIHELESTNSRKTKRCRLFCGLD